MAVSFPLWAPENSSVELPGASHYSWDPWGAPWAGSAPWTRSVSVVQAGITPERHCQQTLNGATHSSLLGSLCGGCRHLLLEVWRQLQDDDSGVVTRVLVMRMARHTFSILVSLQIIHKYFIHFSPKSNALGVAIISRIQMRNKRLNGELPFRHQGNNGAWEPHLTCSLLLFPWHLTQVSLVKCEGRIRICEPYLQNHWPHQCIQMPHRASAVLPTKQKMYLKRKKISIFKNFWDMLYSIINS